MSSLVIWDLNQAESISPLGSSPSTRSIRRRNPSFRNTATLLWMRSRYQIGRTNGGISRRRCWGGITSRVATLFLVMFIKSIWIGFIGVMLFAASGIGRALVVGAVDPLTQYTSHVDTRNRVTSNRRLIARTHAPEVGEEIKMWMKHDFDFEALHGHPQFQRLLKSIT